MHHCTLYRRHSFSVTSLPKECIKVSFWHWEQMRELRFCSSWNQLWLPSIWFLFNILHRNIFFPFFLRCTCFVSVKSPILSLTWIVHYVIYGILGFTLTNCARWCCNIAYNLGLLNYYAYARPILQSKWGSMTISCEEFVCDAHLRCVKVQIGAELQFLPICIQEHLYRFIFPLCFLFFLLVLCSLSQLAQTCGELKE